MTKTCSHCSAPNTADSRFCQLCGKPFADGTRTQSDTPAEQSTVRWQGKPIQMLAQMRRSTSLEQLFAKKTRVLIGRAPECDVCLPHPMVSRYHAELQRTPDGQLRIADRGSMNGITVGGRRLMGAAVLHDREQVGIGPFLFSIAGQTLVTIDNSRGLRLEAQALQKVVTLASGEKRAFHDDNNLVIEPGQFRCLPGPSGAR